MNELDKLQQLLTRLPGVGPRQARRFAFFLMQIQSSYIDELIDSITSLRQLRHHCKSCNRIFFTTNSHHDTTTCSTCIDQSRDSTKLLLVLKQADFEQIEKSAAWDGYYFLINRSIKIADKNPENLLPLEMLRQRITNSQVNEIVFGLPINPEGEYTTEVLETALASIAKEHGITLSHLARGLSSGSELEYSDPQTLESALENRH
jgi:recombination protein RecR